MSDLSDETIDPSSVYHFIKRKIHTEGFAEFSASDRRFIADACVETPEDPSALIANGFVAWSDGKFDTASGFFERAFMLSKANLSALRGFEIGVTSWIPCPDPEGNAPKSPLFFPGLEHLIFLKTCGRTGRTLTVLSSCDDVYFREYGSNFLCYARRNFKSFNVHLHVIYPSEDTKALLKNIDMPNLSITIEEGLGHPHRAYYASRRFLIAPALFDFYSTDLLITDIDVFPSGNAEFILDRLLDETFDIACGRISGPWMPWNKYIVSQVLVRNSAGGRAVLARVAFYMQKVVNALGSFSNAWWIDQNAMYHAIETGRSEGSAAFQFIHQFGKLFIGPNSLGKRQFAALCTDFSRLSGPDGLETAAVDEFFRGNRSAFLEDVNFFKTFLVSEPHAHTEGALELLISLDQSNRLPARLNDHLIACLFSTGDFAGSLGYIRRFCGVKHLGPRWTAIEEAAEDRSGPSLFIEKILPVLLRAGMDYSIGMLGKRYSGIRPDVVDAVRVACIRRLIRRGDTKGAMAAIRDGFSRVIMVIGLQRSGTNFVAELLRTNTRAYVPHTDDRSIFWKHSLADEENTSRVNPFFRNPVDALARMNADGIVVFKSPVNWIESITRRNPADFFRTRRGYVSDANQIAELARFYRRFLESWQAAGERVRFVQYESVLANPEVLFSGGTGLSRIEGRLNIPTKVPYTKGAFDDARKELYLGGSTGLGTEEVALIQEIIPDSFMDSIRALAIRG